MEDPCSPKKTVLVVDDERDICMLLRIVLEEHGYKVLEASDGQKALELLESDAGNEKEIRCVITDYLMPRMNGFDLCKSIKANPRYQHIKDVILITAFLDRDRFERMGCFSDKLLKPIDFPVLLDKLSSHMMN
jgi:CheY-like chemotaxis protein